MIYQETTPDQLQEQIVRIHLVGRRWWAKSNSTTYFSAEGYINGKLVSRIEYEAGHGNHWEHKIFDAMQQGGFITDRQNKEASWNYCERKGIDYTTSTHDVQTKKAMLY